MKFSVIEGWAMHRALVIKRKDGAPITYDEAFLGVPAEVALTLCDAYASGALLPRESSGGEQAVELPQPDAQHAIEAQHADASGTGDVRRDDDVPGEP